MKNLSKEEQIRIASHLCSLLVNETEEYRDIAGISLKMIIAELPINSPISTSIIDQIVPKLLQQLNDDVITCYLLFFLIYIFAFYSMLILFY